VSGFGYSVLGFGTVATAAAAAPSGYDLSRFTNAPSGINYNMSQDANYATASTATNAITGISVTSSDVYLSNVGDRQTSDTYTDTEEKVLKLALDNTDGVIDQEGNLRTYMGTLGGSNPGKETRDVHLDDSAQYILFTGNFDNNVYAGELGTPGDVTSTISSVGSDKSISPGIGGVQGVCWSDDGFYIGMCTAVSSNNVVKVYKLTTAYDVDTIAAGFPKTKTLSGDVSSNGNLTAIKFNTDGTKVFISSNKIIREYALSTPYDPTTMSSPTTTLDLSTYITVRGDGPIYFSASARDSAISGFDFNSDGTELYVIATFGGVANYTGTPSPPVILFGREYRAAGAADPGGGPPTPNVFPILKFSV